MQRNDKDFFFSLRCIVFSGSIKSIREMDHSKLQNS